MNFTVPRFLFGGMFALVSLLLLSACGFSPLYGKNSTSNNTAIHEKFNNIYIANIPERKGQILRNELIDRLYKHGRPATPVYNLVVSPIKETITDLDITKSSDATRAQLMLETNIIFTEKESGKLLLKRGLHAITSYNILQSQFTNRVSARAARKNALNDLARQIETQLALYFSRNNK